MMIDGDYSQNNGTSLQHIFDFWCGNRQQYVFMQADSLPMDQYDFVDNCAYVMKYWTIEWIRYDMFKWTDVVYG